MTKIIIECVEPDMQRLECYRELYSGDWYFDKSNGNVVIRVTGQDIWDDPSAFLVGLHELVEARLCAHEGVTVDQVDQFDLAHEGSGEPGDHPLAPYRQQHLRATIMELLMTDWLEVEA